MRKAHVSSMQEDDGLVGKSAEPGVHACNDVAYTTQKLVLLGSLESDLHEDDFLSPFRMLVEEGLKGEELVAHTLRNDEGGQLPER